MIFLGTPHRGSAKATYGKVLANVAQFMSHRPPLRLLSALQTNSDVLLRLTDDFRFQLPDYDVYSFYEQRPMKGFSSLVREPQLDPERSKANLDLDCGEAFRPAPGQSRRTGPRGRRSPRDVQIRNGS